MISQNLHNAINAQVNAELWSAYLYLAMSLDAEAKGYKGVANWFYVQFQEEQAHARIFMNYLNSRDAKVELLPIEAVPSTWDSVQDMFRQTLEHEKKVTSLINNLAAIANEDRDYASINRIVWFIDEQVEEEESAREMILMQLKATNTVCICLTRNCLHVYIMCRLRLQQQNSYDESYERLPIDLSGVFRIFACYIKI